MVIFIPGVKILAALTYSILILIIAISKTVKAKILFL